MRSRNASSAEAIESSPGQRHEFVWDGRGKRGEHARLSIIAGCAASDLRLSGLHFRILAHLGRFNDKLGWCRMSQTDLASIFQVRRQSVNKATNELVEWGYIQKRDQHESRESFCLYRATLDRPEPRPSTKEGGVSGKADTPRTRGVSAKADTRVRLEQTGVSPRKDTLLGHVEHIDTQKAHTIFTPGAGDRLIPFDATDPATVIANGRIAALQSMLGEAFDGIDRLPFTIQLMRKIQRMNVDPKSLIERYLQKTNKRRPRDPCAYLMRLAQEAMAKRDGIPIAVVAQLANANRGQRARIMAAAVTETTLDELCEKGSKARTPNAAALIAGLGKTT
jgi:hypothetical protein